MSPNPPSLTEHRLFFAAFGANRSILVDEMLELTRPVLLASLGSLAVALVCTSCDGAPRRKAEQAVAKEVAENKAAEERDQKEQAKRRAEARKLEEERSEKAYQEAKGTLEPLAKVPKKHPKGFGTACDAMLVEYDAFMLKTLEGDALAQWKTGQSETRIRVLRHKCHERSVEVVVCETQVLKKAPDDAKIDHIMRVCLEKFG
jgi:hypothetical protein